MFQAQLVYKCLKTLTIFGQVDRVGRGAEDRDALGLERVGQFQRGLPAELHYNTVQRAIVLFDAQNFQNVLQRQRLEIEPVRGVVIGTDRFRVAVDHDRLVPRFRQRETGMATAVIKLDPLADPVGAAAQDHDLLAVRRPGLAFHIAHHRGLVGGIHIGRLRLEFRRAGVDALENGRDPGGLAGAADIGLGKPCQSGQARIGETQHLEGAHPVCIAGQTGGFDLLLGLDDLADAGQEPRVEGRGSLDFIVSQPFTHGLRDGAQPVGRLPADRLDHGGLARYGIGGPFDIDLVKAGQAGFHAGQRLLHRLVETAADRHHLANRFHRGGQVGLRAGEFLEGEARDLGDHIVDARLEAGGGHPGDVVVELVERIAHRQLGGDLGDGEAGGL